ncbi:hypothetical protein Q5424_27765 [Conexibacter sp. JD483]|uniref:hypothetical protein n=1 Tax=unclassified Conexibacter TaxID=2627773 RepID=UPI0027275771|nr:MULTISPECIES: hypothetical protein [unclassified Conexibacter]MDO8189508.1 hypothetical protein [Conexibacter sp. CPCC 205706]MDO8202090.1 hypothetical protein [Conexibacter sp. CPCC 205762]MDR9372930.1 hypothetical protein [Conexibacter sp. JD483]
MRNLVLKLTQAKPIAMGIAAGMIVLGVMALIAGNYDKQVVRDQLEPQAIFFPKAGDDALPKDLEQYAGQQVDNGTKAKAYAEKYLGRHLEEIGGGKSYAQISTEQMANPDDERLVAQKATMFQGETLRGLLLSVWGWSVVGSVAVAAGILLIVLGAILFVLPLAGLLMERKDGSPQPA